jgi:hypothetical protein
VLTGTTARRACAREENTFYSSDVYRRKHMAP